MLPSDFNRRKFLGQLGPSLAAIPLALQSPTRAPGQTQTLRSTKTAIKIGQIGVKHAHATKLSVYRESPDYEVVGLVEPDEQAWQSAQKQPAFRDLPRMTEEQLLNTPGLQAVLVETEVRDLLSTAQRAVQAGKHVHLDKPAGESYPQYLQLLSAAESKKLLVQMGYMYRYNPAVLLLRKFLDAGWLGDIFEVHAVMSKVLDPRSRRELAEYPGGILFELGGHIMDLVIAIIGAPDKVTPYRRKTSSLDDTLLDNMLAVLETPTTLATVKSSAVEVEGGARRHLVVCGTKGTFQIQPLDNPSATLSLATAQGQYRQGTQTLTFAKFTRYGADATDMAQVIRGEKDFQFSHQHDLAVQRSLLLACGLKLDKS